MLGIPQPTLRSWEIRYGFPRASRSAGGHRRYSDEGLTQLRLMRDAIAQGKRAGDASRYVRLMLDQDNPQLERITGVLAATRSGDAGSFRKILDASHLDLGLAATLDQVLMPAMRQVGEWWESGACDVSQEHFATATARSWLARVTVMAGIVTYEPPILIACGPHDMHTLGLEALAALLAERQRGSRILGARTSEQTLVAAVNASTDPSVVIVSHLASHRRSTIAVLKAVAQTGCPVFYAGNAFTFHGDRRGVPGTYLGESLSVAADTLLPS